MPAPRKNAPPSRRHRHSSGSRLISMMYIGRRRSKFNSTIRSVPGLREEVLLPAPASVVAQRPVHEDHRGRAAVAEDAVCEPSAVDVQPIDRAFNGTGWRGGGRRYDGGGVFGGRVAAAGGDEDQAYPQSLDPGATRRMAFKKANGECEIRNAKSSGRSSISRFTFRVSHCKPSTLSASTLTVPSSLANLPVTSTNGSPRTAA